MLRLFIFSHLTNAGIRRLNAGIHYYTHKKLSEREMRIVRSSGIQRYRLLSLDDLQQRRFIADFDSFWDGILKHQGKNHYFWRNVVSSKMQEWESSAAYLALALFTLSVTQFKEDSELIILPESAEEAEVWRNWALAHKWEVISYGFGWPQRLRQETENILRLMLIFSRSIWKKLLVRPVKRLLRDGASLLVTVYYRQALKTKEYEDMFFGRLHDEIASHGRDTLYLGDAIDAFKPEDAVLLGKGDRPVSIYSLLSWRDIFSGIWMALTRAPRFSNAVFCDVNMSRLLSWHARQFRYNFTLSAEYFYRAVRRACQRYNFSKMLYAYEGNVYERAVVQAFRQETSAPIDAYSHAVLYPLNLKLHASPSETGLAPEPDRYLVCSDYTCSVLKWLRSVKTAMIPACFLRPIPQPGDIKKRDGANVLVVLDGFWSTGVVLDWLYQNAGLFKGRQVIVRFHPNAGSGRLLGQCPNYQKGLFCISQQPLKEDLENAFCVLYRQSSVGIQALMHGIPIIYLKIDQPFSGDPLEGTDLERTVVTDAPELSKALSRVPAVRDEILAAKCDMRNFATRYFTPPSPESLRFFIEIKRSSV